MKRAIPCIVAIFLVWSVWDFIIGMTFMSADMQATANLWRPLPEMKMGLMSLNTLISTIVFVLLYALFVSDKSLPTALKFSLILGLGTGVSSGYGSYAILPIPYSMALTLFLSATGRTVLGGLLVGLIVKKKG